MLRFVPDADPRQQGLIAAGSGFKPTMNGYRCFETLVEISSNWNAGAQVQTIWGSQLAGVTNLARLYAATNTKIYELTLASATYAKTDVSKGGGSYTFTGSNTDQEDYASSWAFTSYGTIVIAGNAATSETALQTQSASGSAFTSLSGSPNAATLETFKDFIVAGNVGNYGSITGTFDMVAWSALGDYTSWTPSAATQAGNQRLTDSAGPITCIKRLADNLVVYKARAVYLATYVDNVTLFSFQKIADNIGCRRANGYAPMMVDIGNAHIFVGFDDIYMFDGTRPVSITADVRAFIKQQFSLAGVWLPTHMTHDPASGDVYFWRYNLVYNYRYNKWGLLPLSEMVTAVYRGPATATLTLDPSAALGQVSAPTLVALPTTFKIVNRYPVSGTITYNDMVLQTGDMGSNEQLSTMTRLSPVFTFLPSGGSMVYKTRPVLGGVATSSSSIPMDTAKYRFDLLGNSTMQRWHSAVMTFQSTSAMVGAAPSGVEIIDFVPAIKKGGAE